MRAIRFFAVISLVAGVVTVVACQEPTQVTIEVRLATAKCTEIHGTAINVGVQPSDTEEKVKSKFPNAQTTDCDDGTNRIGTLVITPGGEERGSVIVITSYGNRRDPTECQPPLYTDCIVARRQFTFTKHRRLSMPITIDPTCVNVPCDAFSTCRKGSCFASDAEPCEPGEKCLEPGENESGGTNFDASVPPDTGSPSTNPVASCVGTVVKCGDAPCGAGTKCCNTAVGAICQPECGVQLCCSTNDCAGRTCSPLNGLPPKGTPEAGADAADDDAGVESGTESGLLDTGTDTGTDTGVDTGTDTGTNDSGGGNDSGPNDSGPTDSGAATDSGSGPDAGGSSGLGICN